MPVTSVEIHAVQCDGVSESVGCCHAFGEQAVAKDRAVALAAEVGWLNDGDRWYCPECRPRYEKPPAGVTHDVLAEVGKLVTMTDTLIWRAASGLRNNVGEKTHPPAEFKKSLQDALKAVQSLLGYFDPPDPPIVEKKASPAPRTAGPAYCGPEFVTCEALNRLIAVLDEAPSWLRSISGGDPHPDPAAAKAAATKARCAAEEAIALAAKLGAVGPKGEMPPGGVS